MSIISSKTDKYAIFGHPLGHTLSPKIHNRSFSELGIDAVYQPYDISPEDVANLVSSMKTLGIKGANVTVPYKKEIISQLDWISKEAEILQSVNTIAIVDGEKKGFSTDYAGFKRKFIEESIDFMNMNILVIGTGGAASAIVSGLAVIDKHNNVTVSGRNVEKCEVIVDNIEKNSGKCSIIELNSKEFVDNFDNYDIIVQTTPIGMTPKVEMSVIDGSLFNDKQIAYDIVYNPLVTQFLRDAEHKGAQVLTGLDMLIYQAAESFKIWTGRDMPVEVIKEIV